MTLLAILWVFYIPAKMNDLKVIAPIYNSTYSHCEKMRKRWDSLNIKCHKVEVK